LGENDPLWLGFEIIRNQEKMIFGDREGTLDSLVEYKGGGLIAQSKAYNIKKGDKAIVDLKLTKDLNLNKAPYGWSMHDFKAHNAIIQAVHYPYLYNNLYGEDVKFFFFVFEHGPAKSEPLLIQVEVEEGGELSLEYEERFGAAKEVFEHYEEIGFPTTPAHYLCKACPLECKDRIGVPFQPKRLIV
jgi:hypothetical protein